MQNRILKFLVSVKTLKDEGGQDMVEYAIVMGLIALGATASMQGLAGSIATGFTSIGSKLTSFTS